MAVGPSVCYALSTSSGIDRYPAEVMAIEYDPNRSARIALVQYTDGEKRYILAPLGLMVERLSPPALRLR